LGDENLSRQLCFNIEALNQDRYLKQCGIALSHLMISQKTICAQG